VEGVEKVKEKGVIVHFPMLRYFIPRPCCRHSIGIKYNLRRSPSKYEIFHRSFFKSKSQPPQITEEHIKSKIQKALKNIEYLDVQAGTNIRLLCKMID
jgi:hypothetical protein